MKITLSKKHLGSLFRSDNEQFGLNETFKAIQVVLKHLKVNGCNHLQQAGYYTDRGDYNSALKELNLLYDYQGYTEREALVDYLYQAWESYAEYRHHRLVRAKVFGGKVELSCQRKMEECDRGRLQVWRWRNECFSKNSPAYFSNALELLHNAPLFGDLQDGHPLPDLLAKHMQRRHFPKDRLIYKIMSEPEGIYFLEEGEVKISGSVLKNNEILTIRPGRYFGEGAPTIGMYHTAYCRAMRDCTVYLIDEDIFEEIIGQYEGVKHRLVVDSVKQIRSLRGRAELDEIEERKQRRKAQKGIFCTDFKTSPPIGTDGGLVNKTQIASA